MKKISLLLKLSFLLFFTTIASIKSYAQLAWSIDSISAAPLVAVNTNIPIMVYGKMFSYTHGDCDSALSVVGDTIFISVNFRESCAPVNNFSWSSFATLTPLQPGTYYIKVTGKAFSAPAPTPGIRIKVKSFQVGAIAGLPNKKMPDQQTPPANIYPNPASDHFAIRFSNPNSLPHKLVIMNSTGQVVKTVQALKSENNKIERGNLLPGVYYYQLLQGEQLVHSGKLVLQ